MRKIVDDTRLIFKCCSLYYEDCLGQQEICDCLGISRPSVSRMLKVGREQGIVHIEIRNPYDNIFGKMERELEKKFKLNEVIITGALTTESGHEKRDNKLAEEAVKFLFRILEDDEYVGVSMGTTLHSMTRVQPNNNETIKCKFVPIVGGVSESRPDIHSNYIAIEFAKLFGGECLQFFSPAVFSDVNVLKGFIQEKSISHIFRVFKKISTIILGIGIPEPLDSTLRNAGDVDECIIGQYAKEGAVGDIVFKFFDELGNAERFKEFNERIAAIPLEQLKKVRRRIGIAGGAYKVRAVLGAIRGKYINILVTDVECAKALLEI